MTWDATETRFPRRPVSASAERARCRRAAGERVDTASCVRVGGVFSGEGSPTALQRRSAAAAHHLHRKARRMRARQPAVRGGGASGWGHRSERHPGQPHQAAQPAAGRPRVERPWPRGVGPHPPDRRLAAAAPPPPGGGLPVHHTDLARSTHEPWHHRNDHRRPGRHHPGHPHSPADMRDLRHEPARHHG